MNSGRRSKMTPSRKWPIGWIVFGTTIARRLNEALNEQNVSIKLFTSGKIFNKQVCSFVTEASSVVSSVSEI